MNANFIYIRVDLETSEVYNMKNYDGIIQE